MSNFTLTKAPLKRRIRHIEKVPGHIHLFECLSLSRAGREVKHVQEVDIQTLGVRCSCEHFRFKLARHEPTLATPNLHCKHITRAVAWLVRNEVLHADELQVAALLSTLR